MTLHHVKQLFGPLILLHYQCYYMLLLFLGQPPSTVKAQFQQSNRKIQSFQCT